MGNKNTQNNILKKYMIKKVKCGKNKDTQSCKYCDYNSAAACYQFINNIITIKIHMVCKGNIKICDGIPDTMIQFMQSYILGHKELIDNISNMQTIIKKDDVQIGNVININNKLEWQFYCHAGEFFKYHKYDETAYDEKNGHYRLRVAIHPLYGSISVK